MALGRIILVAMLLLSAGGAAPAQPDDGAGTALVLPASVDLRPEFDRWGIGPRRQGNRGTCSVFTTKSAMELVLARKLDKGTPLSVEYLNWAANQAKWRGGSSDGQFFHSCLRGFEAHGICTEESMPYRSSFDPELQPSPESIAEATEMWALGFQFHWIKPLPRHGQRAGLSDAQFHEIKAVLARGYPIAAGSSHSRLLVGYQDDPARPGGGIFLTLDSGLGRYARVTYEFVRNELNDAFWVELPASAQAQPPAGE